MSEYEETDVVTCFLRNRGEVLLLRRSGDVGSYAGRWGAVSGHVEGDETDADARREIDEETGVDATLVRRGEAFDVVDDSLGKRWVVHPYLFDAETRDVDVNWESTEVLWTHPTEILRLDTVPELWRSYASVAPTVGTVANDREHGSSYVSVRGLEVLRDAAGVAVEEGGEFDEVAQTAGRLVEARPSMAALANRVSRVIHGAGTVEEVEGKAREAVEDAVTADARAAEEARHRIDGERVLTLSRSETVFESVLDAEHVFVAESRPDCEGVGVAERLSGEVGVTLVTDAAVASMASQVDSVVVGADTVLGDSGVVNKTGTRSAAVAADYEGVDVYVVTSRDKVSPRDEAEIEEYEREKLYDGDAPVEVWNPVFDVTPAELVTGFVTEDGVLTADDVSDIAEEHRRLRDW